MTDLALAFLIQFAINVLIGTAFYFLGKRAESRRRDAMEHTMRVADMLLDQRVRRAEGASDNVFAGPWKGAA